VPPRGDKLLHFSGNSQRDRERTTCGVASKRGGDLCACVERPTSGAIEPLDAATKVCACVVWGGPGGGRLPNALASEGFPLIFPRALATEGEARASLARSEGCASFRERRGSLPDRA
jgi:hypothetical protein